MNERPSVKTMRLRYAGVCASCGRDVEKGETAHYLWATKSVRCVSCGPGEDVELGDSARVGTDIPPTTEDAEAPIELVQGNAGRAGTCGDCGRRIKREADALIDPTGMPQLCLDCVQLDTVHVLGVAGGGARA